MRSALVSAALALAASLASADTKVVYAEDGQERAAAVLYIAADHLRMELPDAGDRFVLFDAKAQTLEAVDPAAGTRSPLDADAVTRLSAHAAAAGVQMDGQLAGLPPEQRGDVERVLGRAVAGAAQPEATRTGQRANVAGHDCEVVRYALAAQSGELCVASTSALGLSASDARTLAQFYAFADRMGAQVFPNGIAGGVRLAQLGGLPVGSRHAGQPTRVVRHVSHDTLPNSLFTLPASYRREPLKLPAN